MLSSDTSLLFTRITIGVNDFPHGLLSFENMTLPMKIAEDDVTTNDVTVEVPRLRGRDGNIKVYGLKLVCFKTMVRHWL